MRKGVVICSPDVEYGPLALLEGSFEEKVKKASKMGYDGIELMVRDPALLDWSWLKGTIEDANLDVPQIVTGELYGADGLSIVTADFNLYRRTVDRVFDIIDLANHLGAMVNIGRLRGRLDNLGTVPNAWEIAVERLNEVASYAAAKDVRIALEPLNRYEADFILTVEEGMRFIADLQTENVGLMLDLFHMNIEEPNISESLCLAGYKLWHVHIADSGRKYPGSGHLDIRSALNTLITMGYKGYVSAEILPFPDADTAALKTITYMKMFGDIE